MRSDVDSGLEAIRRGLRLPRSEPSLVLIGATDADLGRSIERVAATHAISLDVRRDPAQLVVADGLAFLVDLLDAVDPAHRSSIRLAFADPAAIERDLIDSAIGAIDLADYANRLERADLAHRPPHYEVRYQPVLSMQDRSVIGYESLLRAIADDDAEHPTVIDAEDLIASALRGNWIGELDQLGRALAVRGVGPWLGEGLLFLNVMAPKGRFDEVAINDTIDAAIEAGIDPDQIVLEAVERNRYTDLADAAAQVERLRRRGVRIAVDDFGDGYANLRVLSAFAPDIVKIAGHLVGDLTPDPGSNGTGSAQAAMATAIVSTIVEMAHRAGAWVVAENIENEEQFELLAALDVDWGQGLHLGAPAHR